jgi:transposase
MGEQRQRFSEEFKRQTVKYIQEKTKTVPEIALELGISAGTIHQWKAKYREFENESLVSPEKVSQLEQLLKEKERENQLKDLAYADLQEEMAILKKALHIFSKERN